MAKHLNTVKHNTKVQIPVSLNKDRSNRQKKSHSLYA